MFCALFCPFSQGPTRGNITSVQRIAKQLQLQGSRVQLIPLDTADREQQLNQLVHNPPDLLHAFHAHYAGPAARAAAAGLSRPYLITLTGSDLFDPALRDHVDTRQVLADAAAVICFDPLVAQQALAHFPRLQQKLQIIPQGVEPFAPAPAWPRNSADFVILLPAALRPVKGIIQAIEQLTPLAVEQPRLQLWIAGGAIDKDYAAQIQAAAALHPWITLLGEVPYTQMGSVYAAADLILNSSLFEGGMANALLEAMVMGKAVVAADIPGNRSLIRQGETGWLYSNGDELRRLVRLLSEQPDQLLRTGRAAQEFVVRHCAPDQEAAALLRLYRQISGV